MINYIYKEGLSSLTRTLTSAFAGLLPVLGQLILLLTVNALEKGMPHYENT